MHVECVCQNLWVSRKIRAAEHDASVNRCRAQGHIDLLSGVDTHAGGADDIFESALFDHLKEGDKFIINVIVSWICITPAEFKRGPDKIGGSSPWTRDGNGVSGNLEEEKHPARRGVRAGAQRGSACLEASPRDSKLLSVGLFSQKGRDIVHLHTRLLHRIDGCVAAAARDSGRVERVIV